jgi:DNA modification methylase
VSTARYLIGDVFDVLRTLPAGSVDCVITSPPYLQLRSYLPAGHPDKHRELGQEDSPAEFLEALLRVMDALWPLLADDATFWIVLGDAHAGSGGAGGDYNPGGLRDGQQRFDGTAHKARRLDAATDIRKPRNRQRPGSRPPGQRTGHGTSKQARAAVAYRNPNIDGGALRDRAVDEALGVRPPRTRTRRTLPGWPADQSVCWIPHLFGASLAYGRNLLTGAEHRQWVTRPPVTWCKLNPVVGRLTRTFRTGTELVVYGGKHQGHYFDLDAVRVDPTHGYHFDDRVAPTLRDVPGQATRRTNGTRNGRRVNANERGAPPLNWWVVNCVPYTQAHYAVFPPALVVRPVIAGCPPGGLVLDPFAGSGTTLQVATGHGRQAIGIDLDARNADLARSRLGMLLDISPGEAPAPSDPTGSQSRSTVHTAGHPTPHPGQGPA